SERDWSSDVCSSDLKNRLAFLIELANTERDLNNYKRAYELLEEHRVLNDSVHAENIRSQIANLEAQYRTSEKEKEILTLQNKRKIGRASCRERVKSK